MQMEDDRVVNLEHLCGEGSDETQANNHNATTRSQDTQAASTDRDRYPNSQFPWTLRNGHAEGLD
jgi:hypothetical protein